MAQEMFANNGEMNIQRLINYDGYQLIKLKLTSRLSNV